MTLEYCDFEIVIGLKAMFELCGRKCMLSLQ